MPHTLYIDYSHNNHLKIFLCKLNFLIGKDFKIEIKVRIGL